jgi:hypothetical protein
MKEAGALEADLEVLTAATRRQRGSEGNRKPAQQYRDESF